MAKSLEEQIEELSRAFLTESNADVELLCTEARAKEAEILAAGQEAADKLRASILEKAARDAELLKEEKLADVRVRARMQWYERREILLDAVFDGARERFSALVSSPEYAAALPGLIAEAISCLQTESVVLHLDSASHELLSADMQAEIRAANAGVEVRIGDDLDSGIGVLAEDTSGHRVFNNTLEQRLERQAEGIRSAVYKVLIGEES